MNLLNKIKICNLLKIELIFLSLMLISLPNLEAPKNIFLILFVLTALVRQFRYEYSEIWDKWDWMFLTIIVSGILSSIFAGLAPGDEWGGFRTLLTSTMVGWLVARGNYTSKQISVLFLLSLLSVLPALFFGLWQVFVSHSKESLEIHSVGHVNHSAIYLTILFGAAYSFFASLPKQFSFARRFFVFLLSPFFILCINIMQSRAAFGVVIITSLVLSFISRANKVVVFTFLIMLTLFFSIMLSDSSLMKKNKIYIDRGDVLSGRAAIWNTTVESAKLYPLFGIGIDNRSFVTKEIIKKSFETRGEYFVEDHYDFHHKHSHNFYLTIIAERGIIGATVILIFIFLWLKILINNFYSIRFSEQGYYLWSASLSAFLATFIIGLVNTTFHHEHGILACFFLGLHLAFIKKLNAKS